MHVNTLMIKLLSGRAAIMDACSLFNATQFQSERGIFQSSVRDMVVARYDSLYCDIIDLQVITLYQ